ncbi:MAG TPA: helix-turn-helix domain-containing protein [Anaerohalosphaeraceae bacterium]|nr:helix-turn-helix domain-containing protein [Anaerohalosphaeraceae bacterium]
MKLEELLRFLAREITGACGNITDYDQVSRWPKGQLEELMKLGVIIEAPPGSTAVCHECGEDCCVEPTIVTYPDNRTVGLFSCRQDGHSIEVSMEHFKRWEVLPDKLAELGYGAPIKDEELTNEQAAELLGVERGTISKFAKTGLLKDNGKSGQNRRVLKSSVLLLKDKRDMERQIEDAKDKRNVEGARKHRSI